MDVDFPIVWREMAGLDSIVQAAGRCNRNGRRVDEVGEKIPGDVFVFELTEQDDAFSRPGPRTFLGKTRSIASELLNVDGLSIDATSIDLYFRRLYQTESLDAQCVIEIDDKGRKRRGSRGLYEEISDCQRHLSSSKDFLSCYMDYGYDFEAYARTYKVIDDEGEPVFVPWDEGGRRQLKRLLDSVGQEASLIRSLQPYSVSVYKNLMQDLEREGLIEHYGLVSVLRMEDDCRKVYSEETGLLPPDEEVLNILAM